MKFVYLLLLPVLIFGQNNFAIDFESTNASFIKEAVANYRGSDSEGFVSMWIQLESTSAGNITLLCVADEAAGINYTFCQIRNGYIAVNMNGQVAGNGVVTSTTTSLLASTPYHIVFSTGSVKRRMWVNGIEQTTVVAGNDILKNRWFDLPINEDNFILGKYEIGITGSGGYFDGIMDEVAVFSSAADQTIVDAIYNNGVPKDETSRSGLVTYIRMEEGTGTATTSTPDGLVLDFTNTAWVASPFGWDAGTVEDDKKFKKFKKFPKYKE